MCSVDFFSTMGLGLYFSEGIFKRNVTSRKIWNQGNENLSNYWNYLHWIILYCFKHEIYFNSELKSNRGHCLKNKVASSLLCAKQCTAVLNTTDGSHHLILDMRPHEVFPCIADSLHSWQKFCWRFTFPPSLSTSSASWSSSSDTS